MTTAINRRRSGALVPFPPLTPRAHLLRRAG